MNMVILIKFNSKMYVGYVIQLIFFNNKLKSQLPFLKI